MSLDNRVLNANLSPEERRLRRLQRSLLEIPVRRARLRAEILSTELGSANHPIAATAWQRVRDLDNDYRAAVQSAGLS